MCFSRFALSLRCKNSAKFFDLKVQSAKEILTLSKKRKNFFVLFSLNRNFAAVIIKRKRIMTAITINIPNHEVSFFKKMMEKMGWTYSVAEPRKPRLYDPETGEYLNDETMQAIEDVRSGKEPVYEMKSMDEFKAWCEAL